MILEDLKEQLHSLGIKEGDTICVSSNIARLGIPLELKQEFKARGPEGLLEVYYNTLLAAVGGEGSILMPTYTYSACKGEEFDLANSPSTVGKFTEWFRTKKATCRSSHPIFSYAGKGPAVESILKIDTWDSYGVGSFFEKMRKIRGKYLMFGCHIWEGATYVYHSEQLAGVKYRYIKNFEGKIRDANGGTCQVTAPYFVRDLSIKYFDSWVELFKDSKSDGVTRETEFRGAPLILQEAEEIHKYILKKLKGNPDYLISFEKAH